jgi:hypothetical protein
MITPSFKIEPYVGPLPLRFGMTEQAVAAVIGAPLSKRKNHLGEPAHDHGFCAIGYDKQTLLLNYVGIRPEAHVSYRGISIFEDPNALASLVAEDGSAVEFVGFILLRQLGIALSGFHDGDTSQRAVNLFERGRYDKFSGRFKPFNFNANPPSQSPQ